jgi:hypothetical protein
MADSLAAPKTGRHFGKVVVLWCWIVPVVADVLVLVLWCNANQREVL